MGREENVMIFKDTERIVKSVPRLSEAVKNSTSGQFFCPDGELGEDRKGELAEAMKRYAEPAKVVVSKKRSFEAAQAYKENKTCVHNFASATTPGGGVVKGSSAQEECLCRCSTLYFSLNTPDMWGCFYTPHRIAQDPVHNDDMIYTPEVYVIKTDTAEPKLMPEAEWYPVNVITCAAPNLRQMPSNAMNMGDGIKKVKMADKDLQELHERRLGKLLELAAAEKNEVVILGAFGCGAFENDPRVVAQAAKNVIQNYRHCFKVIEFAIYCSPRDEENYKVFERTLMGK